MNTNRFIKAKQKLAAGALNQARRDLRRFRHARKAATRELYLDAHNWVVSESCRLPFSFRNVCQLLDLVPEELRRELLDQASLSSFHYCSRRFGYAFRQFQLSLRNAS